MADRLPSPALCLITDETRSAEENEHSVRAALDGGCRWIQLRNRRISTLEFFETAKRLRRATQDCDAVLIINDRIDVAVAVDADGAHLPTNGLAPSDARRLLGSEALLGRSVHSLEEIVSFKEKGVDYFQFGPIFDTASKRAFGPPQGLDELGRAAEAAGPIPICAVGGITTDRASSVLAGGARGVAVIGAVHAADDGSLATQKLLASLDAATD